MMVLAEDVEGIQLELARSAFELSKARVRLTDAVVRASQAGLSQRAIAAALGTNQVAVHRLLARQEAGPALPEPVHYNRRDARFRYELHREIARHVLAGDLSRERAEAELERIRGKVHGRSAERWMARWQTILRLPPQQMVQAFLVSGDEGDDLRQVSPLLGIATEDERTAALDRAYRR